MYYIKPENGKFDIGFYNPGGSWRKLDSKDSLPEAITLANILNGQSPESHIQNMVQQVFREVFETKWYEKAEGWEEFISQHSDPEVKNDKYLLKLIIDFTDWSLRTFEKATPKSSLIKLRKEVEECEQALFNRENPVFEYVDIFMCLLDSAARTGISIRDLTVAFSKKLEQNKKDNWIMNPDRTYSRSKFKGNPPQF